MFTVLIGKCITDNTILYHLVKRQFLSKHLRQFCGQTTGRGDLSVTLSTRTSSSFPNARHYSKGALPWPPDTHKSFQVQITSTVNRHPLHARTQMEKAWNHHVTSLLCLTKCFYNHFCNTKIWTTWQNRDLLNTWRYLPTAPHKMNGIHMLETKYPLGARFHRQYLMWSLSVPECAMLRACPYLFAFKGWGPRVGIGKIQPMEGLCLTHGGSLIPPSSGAVQPLGMQ